MTQTTPFLPGLSLVSGKPLTAAMDAGNLSSNGGLIVLREIAIKLGLADVLTRPLPDNRNRLLVTHSYAHMATARMMAIAAGYEDCDDLDALRHDPALKIACERAPETGAGIARQPTLSRLENLASWRQLARIGLGMIVSLRPRPPCSGTTNNASVSNGSCAGDRAAICLEIGLRLGSR